MSSVRFVIVQKPATESDQKYLGMDRITFGSYSDIPEQLILEGMSLLDIDEQHVEVSYCNFWEKLLNQDYDQYDLLALGIQPGENWELLGYDVGEKTQRNWSVLVHWHDFMEPKAIDNWVAKLNVNGLFTEPAAAMALLNVYLRSGDPDLGWSADGWDDQQNLYDVVPIYRYKNRQPLISKQN